MRVIWLHPKFARGSPNFTLECRSFWQASTSLCEPTSLERMIACSVSTQLFRKWAPRAAGEICNSRRRIHLARVVGNSWKLRNSPSLLTLCKILAFFFVRLALLDFAFDSSVVFEFAIHRSAYRSNRRASLENISNCLHLASDCSFLGGVVSLLSFYDFFETRSHSLGTSF